MSASPRELQHDFYEATAARYDREFVRSDDPHAVALSYISMLLSHSGYQSVLDVGAGTGRGVRHLLDRHPDVDVRGIEPVRAMIEVAERLHRVPAGCIEQGVGDPLPFAEDSFDAVCELGVLHHVADPNEVVRHMTRVARRAVFLSDENRFARGTRAAKLSKYALYRLGAWPVVRRLRTRGRGYHLTEDGGVSYSYSVYDSLPILGSWADRLFLVPTVPAPAGWFHPLFDATHLLVCAIRDGV
jgi:SAM-dependent methyltransferase